MARGVERFEHLDVLVALVVRGDADLGGGVHFLTEDQAPMQLAHMERAPGQDVAAHVHNRRERRIEQTSEVLVVRSGRMLAELFAEDGQPLAGVELGPGDVILLASGGHRLTMLEPCRFLEVKQGPYLGADDKRPLPAGRP